MARVIALEILVKYLNEGSYLNILLNNRLENCDLSRVDKDLVTRLVYGTVQHKLYLEYQLEPYIKDKSVKAFEKMLLLMSIYQLIFLDKVPEYAVINEAVDIANNRNKYVGKFINAILRNFLRNGKRSTDDLSLEEKLSIETSHPLWLVKMMIKQYDLETTIKICNSSNDIPLRMARVNTLKATKEMLLEDEVITGGKLSEDGICFKSGNIALTNYFINGEVTIQDESSQLVARFLDPNKDDYILDMCCAPGSKTTHLSALMENQGKIIAYDLFEHKIKLVEANIKRLGVKNIECHSGDSTKLKDIYPHNSFDKILLDAPCSGLGVLKRKPEIKYHDSNMMDTIIPLQLNLLENAYYLLKKDGRMVYSTCTINKKENELLIEKFIKTHPDMKVIEQRKILPFEYDSDGFFMCKLEKGN